MPVTEPLLSLVPSLNGAFFRHDVGQKEAGRVLGHALATVEGTDFESACQYAFDVLAHPAGALSRFQAQLGSPGFPPLLQSLVRSLAQQCFENQLGRALNASTGLSPTGFRSVVTRHPSPQERHPAIDLWAHALWARELTPTQFVEQAVAFISTLTYSNQAIAQAQHALVQHYQTAIDQAAGPTLRTGLSLTTHELSSQALEGLQEGLRQAFEKDPSLRSPQRMMAFTAVFHGLTDAQEHHAPQSPTHHPFRPRR